MKLMEKLNRGYKKLKHWYIFPINNPKLTPSVLWTFLFALSIPALLVYLFFASTIDSYKQRKIKRAIYKKEYAKSLNDIMSRNIYIP